MKLVFLLIALFVLGCMLYGVYAGISALGRIGALIGGSQDHGAAPPEPAIFCMPSDTARPSKPNRDYVAELQALFTLYQDGALTADEFAQLKQHLLAEIN